MESGSTLPRIHPQPQEVTPLLAAIDFTYAYNIADFWTGNRAIASAFNKANYRVITSDVETQYPADQHLNPLHPESYFSVDYDYGVSAVISSPWIPVADPALALVVQAATAVTCLHVPATFVTHAHPAHLAYLKELQHDGRLMCLANLPAVVAHRYMWLIVFCSSACKQQMVRPEFRELSMTTTATPRFGFLMLFTATLAISHSVTH